MREGFVEELNAVFAFAELEAGEGVSDTPELMRLRLLHREVMIYLQIAVEALRIEHAKHSIRRHTEGSLAALHDDRLRIEEPLG